MLVRAFSGSFGRTLAGLVADMAEDAELTYMLRREVLATRQKSMRQRSSPVLRFLSNSRQEMAVQQVADLASIGFHNPWSNAPGWFAH
jgi:hypothetical protein